MKGKKNTPHFPCRCPFPSTSSHFPFRPISLHQYFSFPAYFPHHVFPSLVYPFDGRKERRRVWDGDMKMVMPWEERGEGEEMEGRRTFPPHNCLRRSTSQGLYTTLFFGVKILAWNSVWYCTCLDLDNAPSALIVRFPSIVSCICESVTMLLCSYTYEPCSCNVWVWNGLRLKMFVSLSSKSSLFIHIIVVLFLLNDDWIFSGQRDFTSKALNDAQTFVSCFDLKTLILYPLLRKIIPSFVT